MKLKQKNITATSPIIGDLVTSTVLELIHPDYANGKIDGRYIFSGLIVSKNSNKLRDSGVVPCQEWSRPKEFKRGGQGGEPSHCNNEEEFAHYYCEQRPSLRRYQPIPEGYPV